MLALGLLFLAFLHFVAIQAPPGGQTNENSEGKSLMQRNA